MDDKDKPDQMSGDRAAMDGYFRKVEAVLGGIEAMKAAGEAYLPKFRKESDERYADRLGHAEMTNVFQDILENLAQRPFAKPVKVTDGTLPKEMEAFVEDVDSRGNNLHVFAGEMFYNAIGYSIDWLLIDYTKGVGPNASKAEERAAGARPYWVRYSALDVIAAYSRQIKGKEQFYHVRLREPAMERDGYKEEARERIRVFNRPMISPGVYGPPEWELFEKQKTAASKEEWVAIDGGVLTIDEIPLVPFLTGRRKGGTWQTHPPMKSAIELQLKLYRQETGLAYTETLTAFPMLSTEASPQYDQAGNPAPITVGPQSILWGGNWAFVEPSGDSLKYLESRIDTTKKDIRELGRQPLTSQSGNLTVITTAVAAEKGNAAIQAWALNLSDALERAMEITTKWLKIDAEPVVVVDTDFDLAWDDSDSFTHVRELQNSGLISREATLHEAKRRRILDPDYDADEDAEKLLAEIESGMEDDPPVDPAVPRDPELT